MKTKQIWDLGYYSSDWEEDRDEDEILEDEEELLEEAQIINKINLKQESLSYAEMETVSYSTRLRDVYNDRWWSPEMNAYFVHVDKGRVPSKKGQQLFI